MSDSAPSSTASAKDHDPEAIITLACPACDFALNMRRKHVGLEGKCISCSEPIQAVEEQPGQIVVKWKKPQPASPPETKVVHNAPPKSKTPAEVETKTESAAPSTEEAGESKWGFPDRPETPPASGQEPPLDPLPNAATKTTAPANGFFEDLPAEVSGPSSKDSDHAPSAGDEISTPATKPDPSPPAFSGSDKLDATVALFASDKDDTSSVNPGWGTKVPNEKHASISPFSTGSAEPNSGFAETLFREGVANKTAEEQPKKSLFNDDGGGSFASNALFGSGPSTPSAKSEPAQPKKLVNEDGHELPPLSPEQEEEMAMTMLSLQNERSNRAIPGWQKLLKKLFRLFAVCVILFGIGYAAYVIMPDDKAKAYKKKVLDWLEPGLVIFDYLPGKAGEKAKGFQELDKLKSKVGEYYEEGQSQLNETYKDGESGLDFDSDRGGSGNDENATGLDQLDKLKSDIQGYQKRSQDQLGDTYEGESGLDFDEGRPPETSDILQQLKK